MAELYMYYTVLYRKFSGLRRRYNTYSTVMTNHTRGPLNETVSYQPNSYSDPALEKRELADVPHPELRTGDLAGRCITYRVLQIGLHKKIQLM